MTETRAPVAIVIVTWNSAKFIAGCLESLRKLERPPREIVVVDNASMDATRAMVRERFPEARLIEKGANSGFCRANNTGINQTTSPFVLVLNPDTTLEPVSSKSFSLPSTIPGSASRPASCSASTA